MSEFQLFDELPAHIEAALRDSVEEFGVLVPVFVDQDGAVIDGHHRSRIADALGVTYETVTVEVDDEEHALRIAHTLNADRRQLSTADRLKAAARLRERGHSYRAIGEALGTSKSQVERDLAEVSREGQLEQPSRVVGIDGKSRPAARSTSVADPQAGRDPSTRRPADELIAEQRVARDRAASPAAEAPPVPPESLPGARDRNYVSAFLKAAAVGTKAVAYDAEHLAELLTPEQVAVVDDLATGAAAFAARLKRARSGLRAIDGGNR